MRNYNNNKMKQQKGLIHNYSTPVIGKSKAKLVPRPGARVQLASMQTPQIKSKYRDKIPSYLQLSSQIQSSSQKQIKRNQIQLAPITPQSQNAKLASASPSSVMPKPIVEQQTFQQPVSNSNIFGGRAQSSLAETPQSSITTPVLGHSYKKKKSLSNPPARQQKFQIANVNMSASYKSKGNSTEKSKSKNRKKSNYHNSYNSECLESELIQPKPSARRAPQRDPSRSQLNLYSINRQKLLSECDHSLEFIIVAFCKAFGFQNTQLAAKFVAGGNSSEYAQSLKNIDNFSKINQFLSLLQTNLKTLIRILEAENDYQNVKYGDPSIVQENSSQTKIMNLLAMSLSRSVDERIAWQTCNLLSGIFQNVNGIQINYGFQTMMIRWAMNQDEAGSFKGALESLDPASNIDFIRSCLIARKNHQELNNVVIGLFIEVANMGRSKRKWERQNDNSQLVELFAVILPQYFSESREHEYFDLMHDILESHHFQFEKERIDKQHLLFKMVDKCLYFLSLINDPEFMQLENSVNTRQACMSLICSIWSNNKQIFRHSIHKFIAHFVQLFKPDDKQVTNSLLFDYIEYEQQAKVGKIVLLLLKRNLKDTNKLIKITCFTQLSRLLELFTKREEVDLQNVVFKLIVLQMTDQFDQDLIDVREVVCNFLAKFIMQDDKANIDFIVNTLQKYAFQQIQNPRKFPLFNTCDYSLIMQILKHPKTNQSVALALYDLFFQIIFQEKFFEFTTMTLAMKFLYKLAIRFETDLLIKWKQLIQLGCITLTKLELQINHLKLKNENATNLVLKRHLIFQMILKIVRKTKQDPPVLKNFSEEFLSKFLETQKNSKTLAHLLDALHLTVPQNDNDSNSSIRTRKKSQPNFDSKMGMSQKVSNQASHTKTVKIPESNTNRDSPIKQETVLMQKRFKEQETYRTGGGAVKSTTRFQIADSEENRNDFQDDMVDQSSQTTLRTEIYTSEDEEEMMNYYTYLSTYKKAQPAELEHAKTFKKKEEEKKSEKSEPEEKPREEDVPVESPELSQTKDFKRSNSLSQFQSSIKIMDEASCYLVRTKEQLARPEEQAGGKKAKKGRRVLLRRQSTHNMKVTKAPEQKVVQPSGGKTDRVMFKNKLCLKLNEGPGTDRSIKMNQTIEGPKSKMNNSAKFSTDAIMRVDPNSNYQLKSKYISQDPIMEESLEQSKQKQIKDNIPNNLPKVPRSVRSKRSNKKKEDYGQYIHKTDQPNVMVISSRREAKEEKQTQPQEEPKNAAPDQPQQRESPEKRPIEPQVPRDLPKPRAQTPKQVQNPLNIQQKPQTSKPTILVRPSSRRSNKSLQRPPSEKPQDEPTKPLFQSTIMDSMNDRDEDTDRPSPINLEKVAVSPDVGIQIQNLDKKQDSQIIGIQVQELDSPEKAEPLQKQESVVKVQPQKFLPLSNIEKDEEASFSGSGAKTPTDVKNERMKKLFQHDEEAEKEKSRTIYAQQMKDLGLDGSTPQNEDTSLRIEKSGDETTPPVQKQVLELEKKNEKKGGLQTHEQSKDVDFVEIDANYNFELPECATPVTNQSPDTSQKYKSLKKRPSANNTAQRPTQPQMMAQIPMQMQPQPGQQITYQQFIAQMNYLKQLQMNLEMQLQQLQRMKQQQNTQYFSNSSFNQTPARHQSSTISRLKRKKQFLMNQSKSQVILPASPMQPYQQVPSQSSRSLISNFTNKEGNRGGTRSPLGITPKGSLNNMLKTQPINISETQRRALKMRRKVKREFTETIKSFRISKQDLDTVSQKASERIRNLREKKKQRDAANVSMYGQSEFGDGDIQIDQSISGNNLPPFKGNLTPQNKQGDMTPQHKRAIDFSTLALQQKSPNQPRQNTQSISQINSKSQDMNFQNMQMTGQPSPQGMQYGDQSPFQQNIHMSGQYQVQPNYAPIQYQQMPQSFMPQYYYQGQMPAQYGNQIPNQMSGHVPPQMNNGQMPNQTQLGQIGNQIQMSQIQNQMPVGQIPNQMQGPPSYYPGQYNSYPQVYQQPQMMQLYPQQMLQPIPHQPSISQQVQLMKQQSLQSPTQKTILSDRKSPYLDSARRQQIQ